jgi:hypothetical protein
MARNNGGPLWVLLLKAALESLSWGERLRPLKQSVMN